MHAAPYRSIPIAKRDDLEVVEQVFRGQKSIIVGDPISMEYHRFNDQEFALLDWLDGKKSAEEIKRLFEESFSPYLIEHREIEQYLIQFHQKNLVQSSVSNVGSHLHHRAQKRQFQKTVSKAKSLLSFRLRGWNPEKFLLWLTPQTQWFFSRGMIAINFAIMLAALLLISIHWTQFQSRLPSLQEFLAPKNWLAVGTLVLVTKVLHELGHGIVFTKFGGRCHELGVMIMVFIPTLYVNASSSWKFPNKWKRAAVGAAGMYVELTLAAIATFVWWYSQPGVVQYIALNIMATCSVSSIVLNGNPLMKYDGYFILSDILEIPNLQQRASTFLRDSFLRSGLGVQESSESQSTDRTKTILVLYAMASYLYRFVVVYGVAFVLIGYFRSAGLELLAKWISVFSIGSLVTLPVVAMFKYFRQPGRVSRIQPTRQHLLLGGALLLGIAFFALPLPDSVVSDFIVEPYQVSTVYVEQASPVDKIHVQPGQWVEQGQLLITQRNIDLEVEMERVEGELASLRQRERAFLSISQPTPEDIRERSEVRAKMRGRESVFVELQQKKTQLAIRAPRSGHVLASWVDEERLQSVENLDGFQGWMLSKDSRDMVLRRGQVLCRIGDRTRLQAKLSMDQMDIRSIQVGQAVRLLVDSNTNQVLDGIVRAVSIQNVDRVASAMTVRHGGAIEVKAEPQNQPGTLGTEEQQVAPSASIYQALVEFDEGQSKLPSGFRGTAKIQLTSQSAFKKLHRFLTKLFRFDL